MVPIVSIVGSSGSGKTTLLVKVISELVARGYRVATLKHDAHRFEIDKEGKDSWRHKQAGSCTVAISSKEKFAVIKDVSSEWPPERIIWSYLSDADIVITEGYKTSWFPKIEVVRKEHNPKPICAKDPSLIGYVSDVSLKTKKPIYKLNDFKGIATLIEKEVLKKHTLAELSIIVDGASVPLNGFSGSIIKEAVSGMVRTLKGCAGAKEIELRIKLK
ncbi:MAG: molybdopterin-guanine dinucleotide biosynthesis protein B [Deltaproteobacteria bacterium]